MAEKEKIDINAPIEAKIKSTKWLKLGDGKVSPREKELLDDIIEEHGDAIATTREAMNANFGDLLADVGDLSEGNQRQLREVAEMLGVTLKTKDGGLQMNYELFQKILMFQRDNKMKLTGIVDRTLHAALKEKMGKKPAENPEKPSSPAEEKKETPYTGYTPAEETKTREETIQSIAEKPYKNSDSAYPVGIKESWTATAIPAPIESTNTATEDYERIPPPPVPPTPTGIASKGAQAAEKVVPTVATQPVNTPSVPTEVQPAAKALPAEEVGEYGNKVGPGERNKIVKGAENTSDILSETTSADVLKTKGSTKSITKILDKYLKDNPEKREEMIQALRQQIGDFSRPLQTPEEVGAFQQLFYLAYPERFAGEMAYIDGEYGSRTQETFMRDIFAMGGWQEKMEGSDGILGKNPEEISTYIAGLSEFERDILRKHYTSGNVDQNSSPEAIKQAQLGLVLSEVNVPVDGVWTEKMAELLEYPELAKSLGNYAQNNYLTHAGGKFSCGASVGRMLNGFGIEGLPQSGRDGQNWNEIFDARPDQFTKVKINSPDEAKPGGILCFDGGGKRPRSYMAIRHGHVEVKGTNGWYYHYIGSPRWGGSAGANLSNSKFTGYVYYPRKKSVA